MRYDDKGRELPDDTPVAVPAGFKKPPSIHELIRRYVRSEAFAQKMADAGMETEEEANDFDVEDDDDPAERFLTRHEISAMAAEELRELLGEKKWRILREQSNQTEGEDGPSKVAEGVAGARRSGKEGEAGNKPESGVAAGNRKASSGVAKPEGE